MADFILYDADNFLLRYTDNVREIARVRFPCVPIKNFTSLPRKLADMHVAFSSRDCTNDS